MLLIEYLQRNKLRPSQFAKMVGCETETVRRYARCERIPSPELMSAIVRTTKGEVEPNDFYAAHGDRKLLRDHLDVPFKRAGKRERQRTPGLIATKLV